MEDEVKFNLYKYFARSFLLPLLGMVMVFVLAWRWGPDQVESIWKAGGLLALFAGIFSLQDAAKAFAARGPQVVQLAPAEPSYTYEHPAPDVPDTLGG